MDKQKVADFFNRLASEWDNAPAHEDAKIERILNAAGIEKGVSVLDIGCGTGVLFGDYLSREVSEVLGVDLAQNMLDKAREKYPQNNIKLLCTDAEALCVDTPFDRCVIYNAFPHFPNPDKLVESVSECLKSKARFTIAHGAGRKTIDAHHSGSAKDVSMGLMEASELAKLLSTHFDVDTICSEDDIYIVSGIKKA